MPDSSRGIWAAALESAGMTEEEISLYSSSESLKGEACMRRLSMGQRSSFLNQAYISPNADCPASMPSMPGMMEPSTCPQIPLMSLSPISSVGATSMSHVEVPMALHRMYGLISPPTAPMCASNAPTPTGMPPGMPSLPDHSRQRPPNITSDVLV